MDNEKLIEDLRGLLKQYGEKIPYGELVGAPWPYSRSGDLVWQDPEPYFIEQAATALSTLQAENEKLRNEVERQRRSADDRKHLYENAERAYMKVLAELERVTAERDAVIKELNGVSSLVDDLAEFVDREIHPVVD
ncbi:hypothetical protein, partial [Anaerotignum lactatifermentans]|uniref:hypothetical protein n=1 Tax=Anaerotignum lactatifermentans TaxID=160404 RepID=UPI003AB68C7F